jgi:uncharacterized membrane protein YfcA
LALVRTLSMTAGASVAFVRKGLVHWGLVLPMLVVAVLLLPVGVRAAQGLDRSLLLMRFAAFLVTPLHEIVHAGRTPHTQPIESPDWP